MREEVPLLGGMKGRQKITVEYSTPTGGKQSEQFDTLVVACDPRNLTFTGPPAVMAPEASESTVYKKLINSVFCTHLLEAKNTKEG